MRQQLVNLLFSRNSLVITILTLGFLPLYLSFGGFYIFGDATSQMLPFLYETKRMFASGLPLWSWNTYAGQDFLFSYAYYTTTNPFVWLNCLFPYSMLGIGFTVTIYLKILLCAYVAQLYFRKMGFGHDLSLIGSLFYTFSSWGLTALFYYMFIDPMILFPLLLIVIERFLRGEKHRFTGIIAVTFLSVWINYLFTPGTLIAAAIYFFCRLFSERQWRERWLKLTLQAMGCVALGIALAACILIPVYFILHDSPRGDRALHFDWFALPERFISLLFPKISEDATPFVLVSSTSNINAAYVVVVGLLGSILLLTKKKCWVNWLFCIYIILYLTPLNGIFSLLISLNYTRWAYALVLAIVLGALYYLEEYGFPKKKAATIFIIANIVIYGLIGGLSGYWYINKGLPSAVSLNLLIFVTILVVLNLGCLYYLARRYSNNKHSHRSLIICIAICATAQLLGFCMWASHTNPFDIDDISISPKFAFDSDEPNKQTLERTLFEGTDYSRNLANRSLLLGIPSAQTFHSARTNKIYALNKYLDIADDKNILSFSPTVFKDSYCALMSIRRTVAVTSIKNASDIEANAAELPYYIPMGMAYDTYQLDDTIKSIVSGKPTEDVPLAMLGAIAINADDEADFAKYLRKAGYKSDISLDSVVHARNIKTADYVEGDTRGLSAHIVLEKPMAVFFSFPAEEGFTATVDGKPTKIYNVNLGMTAILLEAGEHNIRFEYFPMGATEGFWVSVCALILTLAIFFAEIRKKKI